MHANIAILIECFDSVSNSSRWRTLAISLANHIIINNNKNNSSFR